MIVSNNTAQQLSQSALSLITHATTNTNPVGVTTNPSGATVSTTGTAAANLNQNEFLTLMLAQLKNQDPTKPVDSTAFLGQLAQMSQVQGLAQLNDSFTSLATSLTSNQALQASSLLGRNALVASSSVNLGTAGQVTGAVNLPQASGQVVMNITNAAGTVVQQINLGSQSAGLANFTWNGTQLDGTRAPAGQYSLNAQYAGANGTATSATTSINATVQSVTMGAGSSGLTLTLSGVGNVPFSSVQQIS